MLKAGIELADDPLPGLDCLVAANAPVDLVHCSHLMRRTENRVYNWNFFRWLRAMVDRLHREFPDLGTQVSTESERSTSSTIATPPLELVLTRLSTTTLAAASKAASAHHFAGPDRARHGRPVHRRRAVFEHRQSPGSDRRAGTTWRTSRLPQPVRVDGHAPLVGFAAFDWLSRHWADRLPTARR